MSMPLAIETSHISKIFGDKIAVEDLSLNVERGEVFGFLGPNGAGKTTSVKMLLSLVAPTGGKARLLGAELNDPAVRGRVGFLPEHFRFYEWLRGDELLALHADLYHMPRDQARRRIAELLDLVGLGSHASKKLRTYSKGMLQRIGLAQALLNKPDLVILDEPTSGLDPVGRRLVRDIIRELSDDGTAVFLNSHLLSEVEVTCDRVAFIKHGSVVYTSDLKSLVDGQIRLQIRAHGITPAMIEGLAQWSTSIRLDGENLAMVLFQQSDLPAVNRFMIEQGADIYSFTPEHISLEDLFIQIVGTDGGL